MISDEDHPFFYNPSTQSSYTSTESMSFMCLPPPTLDPLITHEPSPPTSAAPPHYKQPIIHVYTRRPTNLMESPPNPTSLASPNVLVSDDSNTFDESHAISDESQVDSERISLCVCVCVLA
ncbi:hypothetical protein GUJ93_ZPchr0012g18994 [Zizania palustris]|uniref:Uncharacterized protein n=1 Tax=Zizania palustris TaxID=103762 RepID=A0A8J5WTX6_ZIZPA|nr:hypothetical protein GUJ93_ZPchr0012g18994 [Zizania palustris]